MRVTALTAVGAARAVAGFGKVFLTRLPLADFPESLPAAGRAGRASHCGRSGRSGHRFWETLDGSLALAGLCWNPRPRPSAYPQPCEGRCDVEIAHGCQRDML